MKSCRFKLFVCLQLLAITGISHQGFCQNPKKIYTVNADVIKAPIQPTMYGIFFEDINFAADGGVYAELVKNRSFEFNDGLSAWHQRSTDTLKAFLQVADRTRELPENAHYLKVSVKDDKNRIGIINSGFRGMGIIKGEGYNFSINLRQQLLNKAVISIELRNEKNMIIGKAKILPKTMSWKKYNVKFTATAATDKASLTVWFSGKGSVEADMISLFPEHTWRNRPGGLRKDLVQKLADMRPGFLRFPGGCIVEGRDLANRYQWKKSIGNVDTRETLINRWNMEFKHRLTPDYYQTFGLGFMEYFMTAEDIGAQPLPILNCGMACQYNSGQLVPLEELDPYIQDALDLIEFANGDKSTKWGNLRSQLGHPKPFNMKMIGVGNEQWGEQYIARWKLFTKAIKTKYPYIKIISSVGPSPDGKEFDLLNKTFRDLNADILDEHYYRNPEWFFKNAGRYDAYDRSGPKIFAGEYAAQSKAPASPGNKNNWECALAEAAFMTGLERNADVVVMASYAPLFAHVDAWQWTPNLIWFDNLRSYATPNYYVQQLFSLNKGTDVVPVLSDGKPITGQDNCFATASLDRKSKDLIIKIVNNNNESKDISIRLNGGNYQRTASVTSLGSSNLGAENSLAKPTAIAPVSKVIATSGKAVNVTVSPFSLNIIKVKQSNY